ncbi:nitrate reductase molybdenum cofactor assembly chaperone [Streptomyces sp. 71268]|uniref:nitrate reductase molybdenum cofactor assembly chaperone n=1 Tax=Streptomyces sp. 71268 TaxID=3002640 RepID=UPI0023F99752|nr:nitrate reductase molybdenum cofactor assembly chaperone [Streptomyces sp. 71268]WEV27742.1 nitrate reductase molybdenum cofactor assembly chaperone [Streptomyces sp. 71268]
MSAPAIHQAASLLLYYPDQDWHGRLDAVAEQLRTTRHPAAGPLLRFCSEAERVPVLEAAAHYTDVFDRTHRRTLHLTYYTDGDTRRRGGALAALREVYRAAGWEPDPAELPDHLPLMLEFAARCPRAGTRLLRGHRAGIELLRLALEERGTRYAHVLDAVSATLPGPRPADRAAARRLARTGPPTEHVGLEPFTARPPS